MQRIWVLSLSLTCNTLTHTLRHAHTHTPFRIIKSNLISEGKKYICMISLILCTQLWRHLTHLTHKHMYGHTLPRAHTHTHTPLIRPFIRGYTENGSSNLSLGLESTLYSNCSRDSWQKPRGIAKEHPLSVLPPTIPPPSLHLYYSGN